MTTADQLLVRIDATTEQLRRELKRADKAVTKSSRNVDRKLSRVDKRFAKSGAAISRGLAPAIAALAGLVAVGGLARQLLEVNTQFQDLKSGLETATGSAFAANRAFDDIRAFAKETPFQVSEVTTAFIRLKNLGLDPSNKALRAYGDVAASMPGKSIMDFIEAVADAATGEFERLKEFGIKASSEGKKVSFTFRGITQTIGKNSAEIERYLQQLADNNFGGAMAKKMDNLSGKMSNLKDQWENLFFTIGETGGNSAMDAMIDTAAKFVENMTKGIKVVDQTYESSLDGIKKQIEEHVAIYKEIEATRKRIIAEGNQRGGVNQEIVNALETEKITQQKVVLALNAKYNAMKLGIDASKRIVDVERLKATATEESAKAEQAAAVAVEKLAKAEEVHQKKIKDVVEALEFEALTRGKTAAQIAVMNGLRRAEIDIGDAIITKSGQLVGIYGLQAEKIAALTSATARYADEQERAEQAESDRQEILSRGESVTESNRTAAEKYNATLAELSDLYREGAISAETLARAQEQAREDMEGTNDIARDLGLTFESAFEKAIDGAESFSDILKALEQDLIKLATRRFVTEPLFGAFDGMLNNVMSPRGGSNNYSSAGGGGGGMNGTGGGAGGDFWSSITSGIGSFFGGFFADGGRPPVGVPSIVGEKGPEIFIPDMGGTIVPNNKIQTGGGGTRVTQNFYITTPDADSFRKSQQQVATDMGMGARRAVGRNG